MRHSILVPLILALCLGLSACKNKKSSKTTLHRNKAGQNKTTRADQNKTTPNNTNTTTNTTATDNKIKTDTGGRADTNPITKVDTNTGTGTTSTSTTTNTDTAVYDGKGAADSDDCASLQKKLSDLGWTSMKLKYQNSAHSVAYYLKDAKNISNPVLVLQRVRTRSVLSEKYFNSVKEAASTHSFDPIIFEQRGYGCASAFSGEYKEWQQYDSTQTAKDAEGLRAELIKKNLFEKDRKKWKVWAQGSMGYTALRLIELFPDTIESLHIGDFTPTKSMKTLMTARIEAQAEAWENLKTYAKTRSVSLDSDDIKKAKTTLEKSKCEDNNKICGEKLIDMLVYVLNKGTTDAKEEATDILKALISGDEEFDVLKKNAKIVKDNWTIEMALRLMDADSDLTQQACPQAIKDLEDEKTETVKNSEINSCRIEATIGRQDLDKLKTAGLRHVTLNKTKILASMEKNKIGYYAIFGKKSLFYPFNASDEHTNEFKTVLKENVMDIESAGADVFMHEDLLKTLKAK